jgi:hypothetical protein
MSKKWRIFNCLVVTLFTAPSKIQLVDDVLKDISCGSLPLNLGSTQIL